MGRQFDKISTNLQEFISQQKVFFVGTARQEGRVNVSPKGMDTLRVINPNRVIWLNLTGSGNETAAHLLESKRMTIMFLFPLKGPPLILRLYGTANTYHPRDDQYQQYIEHFPGILGSRQIIELDIDLVQTSCGFGVPLMDFKSERKDLTTWAQKKGEDGIKSYWEEKKNTTSLDGHETHILDQE